MRNSDSIIELIQGEMPDQQSGMIKTQKQEMKIHTVFFDEDIGKPSKYRDLIHLLFLADSYDQFVFVTNSAGGQLTTALAIIEAIKSTEASTRAILIGECHSAASMIALYCDDVIVTDSATMLVHTASFGTEGQSGNVKAHVDFISKHIRRLIDDTYSGFMSESEIADLYKGLEFWFDSKDISKRLDSRSKYLEEKYAKKPRTSNKKSAAANKKSE